MTASWKDRRPRSRRLTGEIRADLGPHALARVPPLTTHPWLAWSPHAVVLCCAAFFGAVNAEQLWQARPDAPAPLLAFLSLLQCAPLVVCLYRPMAGFWLSLAANCVANGFIRDGLAAPVWSEPSVLLHLCVLGLTGFWVRPRVLLEMWLLTVLAGLLLARLLPVGHDPQGLMELGGLSAITLLTTGGLRALGEARRRLGEQLDITASEQERRITLEERGRIARELHDVLAHHMSVIAIQAEAAPHRVPEPPEPLARSFSMIRCHAQDALTELRRVLGVLRADSVLAETGPQPSVRRLDELIDGARAAGLIVTTELTGTPRRLPPGIDVSAYRILQEALNNAMRHAPGAEVHIAVGYQRHALRLSVLNGPAPAPARTGSDSGSGHGLPGMRERVGMLGGTLRLGPTGTGGYAVAATLPTGKGDGS